MNPDFVFIISYECPRCHAALETRSDGVPTWIRCPQCGRASLPPETIPAARSIAEDESRLGSFVTGPVALPIGPRPMAPMPRPPIMKAQTNRILLGSGFFLSIILTLLSMIESNAARSAVFGLTSAFLLFLLSRPIASNRP